MTIISPKNKNKSKKMSRIVTVLILVLLLAACWDIFSYNQIVNVRHNLSKAEVELQEVKSANVEIKEQFYYLTSVDNLIKVGEQMGLVDASSPLYVKLNNLWSAVTASR